MPTCDSAPGIELVTAAARLKRFVVMGERHGTVASPRRSAALVCHIVREMPVNMMLEVRADTGPAVNASLASDEALPRPTFLTNELWDPCRSDGRNSTATIDLVEALRVLPSAGARIRVFATQPVGRTLRPRSHSELGRANDCSTSAAKHPDAVNLTLVGSAHATIGGYADLRSVPATAHPTPGDVFAIGPRATRAVWFGP